VSHLVDARGLRCPWPVLRLAKAMRDAADVTILADDPAAPAEIAAFVQGHGWEMHPIPGGFTVRKSTA
jgi:tRNA 2-thiouridine synthesizing protein A